MTQTAEFAKRLGSQQKQDPEYIRELLREKGRKSLYFLSKAILGYADLTPDLHLSMCYFSQDPTVRRRLMEVPRGHLKTTIATRSKPIWRLIQKPDPPRFWGPDEKIGLAMSGGDVARVQLTAIEQHFEANTLLQWLYPEVIPEDFSKTLWNQDAMRVGGTKSTDPSIRVLGVDTKVTGLHFTGGIEDDLVDETIAESAVEIQRRINFHQYFYPLLVAPGRDWLDTTGNRWGKNDVNGWIRQNEGGCKIFFRQAVKEDGSSLWPERFPPEHLAMLRATLGPYKYSCQYLNDPKDPEAAAFKTDWIRYYEIGVDPHGERVLILDSGEYVPFNELFLYMAVDPAQTPSDRSDRTGIVVTGLDTKGRIYVLEAIAVRKDPYEALIDVYNVYNKWKPSQLGVEAVAFSRLLINPLQRMGQDRMQWLPVVPIKGANTAGAKEARINQVVGESFAAGRAFVRREMADFIDEYTWFPDKTSKRDLLDAFALSDLMWAYGRKQARSAEDEAAAWLLAARQAGMSKTAGY